MRGLGTGENLQRGDKALSDVTLHVMSEYLYIRFMQ